MFYGLGDLEKVLSVENCSVLFLQSNSNQPDCNVFMVEGVCKCMYARVPGWHVFLILVWRLWCTSIVGGCWLKRYTRNMFANSEDASDFEELWKCHRQMY